MEITRPTQKRYVKVVKGGKAFYINERYLPASDEAVSSLGSLMLMYRADIIVDLETDQVLKNRWFGMVGLIDQALGLAR